MSREKLTFPLEKDEDDYPPNDYETLWAESLGGGKYRIDNAPFFVRGVSSDDVVRAEESDDILLYKDTIHRSGNSVVRIIFLEDSIKADYIQRLKSRGFYTEQSHLPSLVVFEVPEAADYDAVIQSLEADAERGLIDYEEAAVRHRNQSE
ncbi:DUF4265 domain-containing protein [Caulobacter sp. LARHSG274]